MTLWPSAHTIPDISSHQAEVCSRALAGPVSILTGGPGTGKTFTAAAILKAIVAEQGSHSIAPAAPTGKAAVRITEAMQRYGLPLEAKTIHRLLGVTRNGHDGKGWGFNYNRENPLPYRIVVIDEVSMLDVDLATALFTACQPGTHILLIGDPGQLPPVQHGAPLRDMLAAGIPAGELTEIRRNAGDIVHACKAIREGRRWEPSPFIDIDNGHNLKHIESLRATHSIRHLERLLESAPAGIDPVWDCQVMVALNESGELSRVDLNKRVQAILNAGGRKQDGSDFRDADKVICTSNCWLPLGNKLSSESYQQMVAASKDMEDEDFVANGEIGQVVHQEKKLLVVKFPSPERTVLVKGEFVKAFDLAYAITVHKSQGSQWKVPIYMSDDGKGARMVASRELIYTALSRAEQLMITIGRKATIDLDCRREALSVRKTFLAEQLRKGLAA